MKKQSIKKQMTIHETINKLLIKRLNFEYETYPTQDNDIDVETGPTSSS